MVPEGNVLKEICPTSVVMKEFEFTDKEKILFLTLVAAITAGLKDEVAELYEIALRVIPDSVLLAAIKRLDEINAVDN